MKNIVWPFLFALLSVWAIGCSHNEIEIRNLAEGSVIFLFRGEQDSIPPGRTAKIGTDDPIPNGTFSYSTTYEVPAKYASWEADENCSGTLTFTLNQTRHVLIYSSSTSSTGGDLTYYLYCNLSSNDPVESYK